MMKPDDEHSAIDIQTDIKGKIDKMEYADAARIKLLIHGILILLIVSAFITDFKRNCIYNWQTYPAVLSALALNFLASGRHGLLWSLSGFAVGFALLIVFYLAGGFGAGDVKLLAAIGALKGVEFVLWTMAYAALVGGIMAFSVMIWKGIFWSTMQKSLYLVRHPIRAPKEFSETPQIYLPYGIAISMGCFWALLTS
jgi:prepilin peptidase CpaA